MSDETLLYGAQPPEEPPPPSYPVRFDIDAPPEVGRLSTFFRLVLLLPLAFALYVLSSASLVPFYWITIIVRGRPVAWVFNAVVAIQRFNMRIMAYALLTTDRYPPFDGDWPVDYEVEMPERIQRRKLIIWKTLASIPHLFVLIVLWFAVTVCVVIAWFAIMFTGRFPLGLRGFVIGWLRWIARVGAYWMSLRDEFPPFSLSAEAGSPTRSTHIASGVGGGLLVGGAVAGIVAIVLATASTETTQVAYDDLLNGTSSDSLLLNDVQITLLGAIDPYTFRDGLFVADDDKRFIAFGVDFLNLSNSDHTISKGDFHLKDTDEGHDPFLISFGHSQGPATIESDDGTVMVAIFELGADADPTVLEYEPRFLQKAKFEFTR